MSESSCRSCGEFFGREDFTPIEEDEPGPGHDSGYCPECYSELNDGELPQVTDSSLAAPGTGMTLRQKLGQRRTDGG